MHVVGIEVRTKNDLEANAATARIAGLWNRFYQEKVAEKIAHRKDRGAVLGVYTNYESDHTGFYTLIVGAQVQDAKAIPIGMVGVTIPAAEYLVFPAPGRMPEAIVTAWGKVWNYFAQSSAARRVYTTDFELYKTTNGEASAEIYVAIEQARV
jgi:predicted transcriptional regulator YdeE